jgi:hypothetical protein
VELAAAAIADDAAGLIRGVARPCDTRAEAVGLGTAQTESAPSAAGLAGGAAAAIDRTAANWLRAPALNAEVGTGDGRAAAAAREAGACPLWIRADLAEDGARALVAGIGQRARGSFVLRCHVRRHPDIGDGIVAGILARWRTGVDVPDRGVGGGVGGVHAGVGRCLGVCVYVALSRAGIGHAVGTEVAPRSARERPREDAERCDPEQELHAVSIGRSFGTFIRLRGVPRFFAHLPRWLFLVSMLLGSALITASSLAYFDFGTLPAFVVEKLPVRFERLWLGSLRVHVATASIAFPLCLLLTTRALQRRPALHRWLGRTSGILVLLALVPSGIVLAFDAKGGAVVTAGFLVSAGIVAWFMVRGVQAARRGDYLTHRRAMRHVVGQMSVAVTSRALLLGLDALGWNPDVAYVVALWGPVLASAVTVEIVSLRSSISIRSLATLSERIRRELHPLALFVRVRSLARPLVRFGR